MNSLKSHFIFTKSERNGILLLVLLIVGLLSFYHFFEFETTTVLDVNSPEIIAFQKEMDSLKLAELEARKPKPYPFNPNFITDFRAYTLGMSPAEFDRLKNFRSKDKWINSKADFKMVTMVSDSLLTQISPFFKFPDWINNPKPKRKVYTNSFLEKSYTEKIDLNIASAVLLQEVSGVGPALGNRIIVYRKKIGSFSNDIQLHSVWGLRPDVIERILNLFTVKTPRIIIKMNINTASASDIATVPGISFDLAKRIWEFIRLREGVEDFSELEKIEGLSKDKLQLIQLYLSVE